MNTDVKGARGKLVAVLWGSVAAAFLRRLRPALGSIPVKREKMGMNNTMPEAGKAILDVIQNQIQNNDPPATQHTYRRLMAEIGDHDEVMRYLGCVLSAEIFDMLSTKTPYNHTRYLQRLEQLPDVSWME